LEKALVFDIWANHAYFRKGYTATSTLSYPFPSRTTIAGLVSGILGLPRDSYYSLFAKENSKIGVRILNPLKKFRMNLNYINTKEGFLFSDMGETEGKRTQIQAEFLKDVKYRIYVSLDDDKIMNHLFNLLSNHKSIYTPCLGISECIANFEMVGDGFFDIEEVKSNGTSVLIDSVISSDLKILIEPKKKYGMIKSPGFFNKDRVVEKFIEYYYEENGEAIKVENANYFKIGEDNVILF
jgi:CRISPR-associated protein Cas5h